MSTRDLDQSGVHPLQAFVSRAREVLSADSRVAAAWLEGDKELRGACSDVDLRIVVEDSDYDEFWANRVARIASIAPLAYHRDLPHGWDGAAAITSSGLRVVVQFERASRMNDRRAGHPVVLLDRTTRLAGAPAAVAPNGTSGLDRLADSVVQCAALLPALRAMGDLRTAVASVAASRVLQVEIMRAENGERWDNCAASAAAASSLTESQRQTVEETLGAPRLDLETLAHQQIELASDVCHRAELIGAAQGHDGLVAASRYLRSALGACRWPSSSEAKTRG